MTPNDEAGETTAAVAAYLDELRSGLRAGELEPTQVEEGVYGAADRAGMDLHFLCSVHEETLLMLVSPAGDPDPERCWLTGEVLFVDGLRCLAEDDRMGALARFNRALLLYRLLDPERVVVVDRATAGERTARIEALLPETPRGV